MDTPQEKTCAKCLLSKPLDAFNKAKRREDGHRSICKICAQLFNPHHKEPRTIPPEKVCTQCLICKPLSEFRPVKESRDGTRHQCRTCEAQVCKEWRVSHPGEAQAYNAAHYIDHADYYRAKSREWYYDNPEKVLDYRVKNRDRQQKYQRDNREIIRLQKMDYRATHPDIMSEIRRRRRALIAQAPINDLTHAQWIEIQSAQNHRCYYCGKRRKGKLTQDHIIPLSKGGSHTLHNVIGACGSCNSSKKNRPAPIPVQPLLLTIAPSRKKVG